MNDEQLYNNYGEIVPEQEREQFLIKQIDVSDRKTFIYNYLKNEIGIGDKIQLNEAITSIVNRFACDNKMKVNDFLRELVIELVLNSEKLETELFELQKKYDYEFSNDDDGQAPGNY